MYTWRFTQPGDIERLRLPRWDEFGIGMQSTLSARLPEMAYAYTLFHDQTPYAVVFGYFTSEGVCDLFMVSDVEIKRHAAAFYDTCDKLMWQPMAAGEVRRWQVHVNVGNDISCSMVEKMGFTLEAQLAAYYPNCDAYLYGKVL